LIKEDVTPCTFGVMLFTKSVSDDRTNVYRQLFVVCPLTLEELAMPDLANSTTLFKNAPGGYIGVRFDLPLDKGSICMQHRGCMMKMRNFMLIAGLLFASIGTANGQTPIKDKDAFEKKYIECIMSGWKNKCFSALIIGHFRPNFEDKIPLVKKELHNIDELANQFGSVYRVHPLDKIIRANIWDNRTYLIEHFNGKFSGAYINFIKIKEEWYVYTFLFDNSEEFIKKLLKIPMN
jgi:hypothetical protein